MILLGCFSTSVVAQCEFQVKFSCRTIMRIGCSPPNMDPGIGRSYLHCFQNSGNDAV